MLHSRVERLVYSEKCLWHISSPSPLQMQQLFKITVCEALEKITSSTAISAYANATIIQDHGLRSFGKIYFFNCNICIHKCNNYSRSRFEKLWKKLLAVQLQNLHTQMQQLFKVWEALEKITCSSTAKSAYANATIIQDHSLRSFGKNYSQFNCKISVRKLLVIR